MREVDERKTEMMATGRSHGYVATNTVNGYLEVMIKALQYLKAKGKGARSTEQSDQQHPEHPLPPFTRAYLPNSSHYECECECIRPSGSVI